ncbi:hypothetical protein [Candidatus Clostridium radicumherbarum]|uniref:Uncharacterized protein n=1 Tax=Candidatus Clostridium radicumherbarum TaxID=3381662 RepID=A0ABW8TMU0_9CLOT
MSMMMSVFEKLNLVEKDDAEAVKKSEAQENNNESINEKETEKASEYQLEIKELENNNAVAQKKKHERNMTINEIYSIYNLENSNINTIFMLGNFINALPENLPYEIKKKTVMNIISASNTDLNKLMSDGEKRINVLKQFSEDFYSTIEGDISNLHAEIKKLSELIDKHKEQISIRTNMLEEQNHAIKYEAQKINSIIDFFRNGD